MKADDLDFDKGGGMITVVTQHAETGAVLMTAYMDREAFEKTIETGEMHYRSRTRGLWHKGATSGNTQTVVSLTADCDSDAILARVIPAGPTCHNGTVSCFDPGVNGDEITALAGVIESRASGATDGHGYTQHLLADRNLRLKKLGEEAAELVVALADNDPGRAAEEGADLLYHMLVALRAQGVMLDDVRHVLAQRTK
jgi:phosphoribosyl-ATP pyrophosphohydrolase/phosphoribosyl-AMP cyclohydrolase